MSHRNRIFAAAMLCAASTAFGEGADCGVPGNLVPNCGFDVDETGWAFSADSVTGTASDCTTGPRCVDVDRHDVSSSVEAWTPCVEVTSSGYYSFGGWMRAVSGTISQGCAVTLVSYSNDTCGGFLASAYFQRAAPGAWRQYRAAAAVPVAAQSALLRLSCYSEAGDFVLRIDDAFVIPAVFVDGFENGDPSLWSDTMP